MASASVIRDLAFQSTLPVWGATVPTLVIVPTMRFQSTLPVWGATRPARYLGAASKISIHAPRVGSDSLQWFGRRYGYEFQSTLPVWGATGLPLPN